MKKYDANKQFENENGWSVIRNSNADNEEGPSGIRNLKCRTLNRSVRDPVRIWKAWCPKLCSYDSGAPSSTITPGPEIPPTNQLEPPYSPKSPWWCGWRRRETWWLVANNGRGWPRSTKLVAGGYRFWHLTAHKRTNEFSFLISKLEEFGEGSKLHA